MLKLQPIASAPFLQPHKLKFWNWQTCLHGLPKPLLTACRTLAVREWSQSTWGKCSSAFWFSDLWGSLYLMRAPVLSARHSAQSSGHATFMGIQFQLMFVQIAECSWGLHGEVKEPLPEYQHYMLQIRKHMLTCQDKVCDNFLHQTSKEGDQRPFILDLWLHSEIESLATTLTHIRLACSGCTVPTM